MSRPHKHPKTGVYYFRKAVPDDLRAVLGKWEVKISLKTKNPADAKSAYATVAAEVESRWKALRAKPEPLTHRQIVALAGEAYRELVDGFTDNPGPSDVWTGNPSRPARSGFHDKRQAFVEPVMKFHGEGLCPDDIYRKIGGQLSIVTIKKIISQYLDHHAPTSLAG